VDIRQYARVFWRFRVLMGIGLIVALGLTFLSVVRVGPHGLAYRQQQKWLSYSQLFVTQAGFPWGLLGIGNGSAPADSSVAQSDPGFADAARLTSLAVVYSQLATTDPVRRIMQRLGAPIGQTEVAPLLDRNANPLPIMSIAGHSDTPRHADKLAAIQATALVRYVRNQQVANGIPDHDRVQLALVQQAAHAQLEKGRSKTLPLIIFLTLMAATCALAIVLDNARPQVQRARPEIARHAA
jgi:hypothetical protein